MAGHAHSTSYSYEFLCLFSTSILKSQFIWLLMFQAPLVVFTLRQSNMALLKISAIINLHVVQGYPSQAWLMTHVVQL